MSLHPDFSVYPFPAALLVPWSLRSGPRKKSSQRYGNKRTWCDALRCQLTLFDAEHGRFWAMPVPSLYVHRPFFFYSKTVINNTEAWRTTKMWGLGWHGSWLGFTPLTVCVPQVWFVTRITVRQNRKNSNNAILCHYCIILASTAKKNTDQRIAC